MRQSIIVPLLLAVGSTTLCYLAGGASLGLFFGGILFAILLAPPLALAHDSYWRRAFVVASVTVGVAIVWLVALSTSPLTFGQWSRCYVVLIVIVAAVSSVAILLRAVKIGAVPSSAIATCATLAWLTCPVWLSPWFSSDRVVARLVLIHPMMAINGALQSNFGVWSQFPLAYHLTNLGQDIAYRLPSSVIPAVVFHTTLAVACLFATRSIHRSRISRAGR